MKADEIKELRRFGRLLGVRPLVNLTPAEFSVLEASIGPVAELIPRLLDEVEMLRAGLLNIAREYGHRADAGKRALSALGINPGAYRSADKETRAAMLAELEQDHA